MSTSFFTPPAEPLSHNYFRFWPKNWMFGFNTFRLATGRVFVASIGPFHFCYEKANARQ